MTPRGLEDLDLWSTIEGGRFFTIPQDDLVRQIYSAFRPEVDRLKCAVAIERQTPPRIELNGDRLPSTPSETLFGENFDEVNRTFVGILALRWTINNDYEQFTRSQPDGIRLTKESFQWLRNYFCSNLNSSADLFSLILSMVVNDLGKDPALVNDYLEKTKLALHGANHDVILLEAAREGMVPCLSFLDDIHRNDIMLGLELGSELNAAQLAQAENVPVNLEGLLLMEGNERAFNLKFMEQILDVAGAAGHVFSDGIKNMIEPVFQAFKIVHEVSLQIIRGKCTLREGYDHILTRRGQLLEGQGFRRLNVSRPDDRALLRLLTMGRTATLQQAELFDLAFGDLDENHRHLLIDGLNIDAIEDNETAVLPYYMPAMIAETLRSTRDCENQQAALTSLMRYLARVLRWTDNETYTLEPVKEGSSTLRPLHIPATSAFQQKEGRVFERNMSSARETISSPEFRTNPTILDMLPPPEGHLLSRRRASQSV